MPLGIAGRWEPVAGERSAVTLSQALENQDIHREATAALVLFQEAARRETLTAELIEEMAARLKRARGNPEDG